MEGYVIGLISDTHGLLRPEAIDALRGSHVILHAGDVGRPEILDSLREIAPVLVVRGNVDRGPWAPALPLTVAVEIEGTVFYMVHNIDELDVDCKAGGIGVVVYGHSHRASCEDRSGVLYVNPGSAGPRRFRLPVTVARLTREDAAWRFSLVQLL